MACDAERVRLLFMLSRMSVAATLAATLLVAVWLWPAVAHGTFALWLLLMLCNIGALAATGTRPYAEGADGFVMGEGAAVFLLKRLADAERAGDRTPRKRCAGNAGFPSRRPSAAFFGAWPSGCSPRRLENSPDCLSS